MLGRLLTLTLTLLLALGGAAHAGEPAAPAPTTLSLSATPRHADAASPVVVELLTEDGDPVVGGTVAVKRRVDGRWRAVDTLVTDEGGRATTEVTLSRRASDNLVRASASGDGATYAGSRSGRVQLPMLRREGVVAVSGPDSVVDERKLTLTLSWRTRNGTPVKGRVQLFRRLGKGDWKRVAHVRTGADGTGSFTTRPRVDSRWRAVSARLDWVGADRSPVHAVDNLPPGEPVDLPDGAPRPRVNVPDQAHAKGRGAHAVIGRIPNAVWRQMTGRSWHRGCPVGRGSLRLLRINYFDYAGYRHRGELVAHADAAPNMRAALVEMYNRKLPIRSMYRVDRFGWSSRVRGADDYKSMAAGNTSAFNCRDVVGRPGVRSPHSYGRALDINPWENPYRSSHGWVPNTWWVGRTHPRVAWRDRGHAVVALMARHGLRWTYGTGDAHHFDAPAGNGRVIMPRTTDCGPGVCH